MLDQKRLVSPARGHELRHEGNVAAACVLPEKLVVGDGRPSEHDLGNEQHGNENVDGHGRGHRGGEVEAEHAGAEGGTEEDRPGGECHLGNLEKRVSRQNVQPRLKKGDAGEVRRLGGDVASPAQMKKALPLQNLPVPNDLPRTDGEPQKHGDDHAHEEIPGNVSVVPEDIRCTPGSTEEEPRQKSQKRRLEECGAQVASVGRAASKGAAEKDRELTERRRAPEATFRKVYTGI